MGALKSVKDWVIAPLAVLSAADAAVSLPLHILLILYVILRALLLVFGVYVAIGLVNIVMWAVPQLMQPFIELLGDNEFLRKLMIGISDGCGAVFHYTNKLFVYFLPAARAVVGWLGDRFSEFLGWVDSL